MTKFDKIRRFVHWVYGSACGIFLGLVFVFLVGNDTQIFAYVMSMGIAYALLTWWLLIWVITQIEILVKKKA